MTELEHERLMKILEEHDRSESGLWKVQHGECPLDALNPMACMFCLFGHMTECHYPYTCEEARCSHYQDEAQAKTDQEERERGS